MQRGGKERRLHDRGASAGLDEVHLVEPANLIGDSDAFVEFNQVRAEAEENVLAVVDDFSGAGMFVRRSATAEEGALLKESDVEACVGEGAGGGESGESASGDGDCGLGVDGISPWSNNQAAVVPPSKSAKVRAASYLLVRQIAHFSRKAREVVLPDSLHDGIT